MSEPRRSVSYADPLLEIPPEPLTLAEAKKHLEIPTADTTHDDEVSDLITSARQIYERDTGLVIATRTVYENLDRWPASDWRVIHNINTWSAVQYYDTANSQQTFSSGSYSVDIPNRRIELNSLASWPTIYDRWDAVTLSYSAGFTTVPEHHKSAVKLQLDILFELRGMTKDKAAVTQAYERLVALNMRGSYP